MSSDLLSPALGLIVGLVVAVTGAGGGILSIPLLVFGLHLPMQTAGPIGLLAITLSAGAGAFFHLREGILRYKAAALLALVGSLMSPVGLWLGTLLPNTPLMLGFAGLLFYLSINLLIQSRRERSGLLRDHTDAPCQIDQIRGKLIWTAPCARQLSLAGGLAGLLSGLLGVGGGFIIVPALKRSTDLSIKSIIATSMGVLTLISLTGVIWATLTHRLDWPIALPFALGSLVGSQLGRGLSSRLQGPRLQDAFACLSIVVGIGLCVKAFTLL